MIESVATVDDVILLCWIFWLLGTALGIPIGGAIERRRKK